jgi:hypothetical protein
MLRRTRLISLFRCSRVLMLRPCERFLCATLERAEGFPSIGVVGGSVGCDRLCCAGQVVDAPCELVGMISDQVKVKAIQG